MTKVSPVNCRPLLVHLSHYSIYNMFISMKVIITLLLLHRKVCPCLSEVSHDAISSPQPDFRALFWDPSRVESECGYYYKQLMMMTSVQSWKASRQADWSRDLSEICLIYRRWPWSHWLIEIWIARPRTQLIEASLASNMLAPMFLKSLRFLQIWKVHT